jgi:cytochrome oxidase Cu insertion factor (SCO1/SenC/PrrC family)
MRRRHFLWMTCLGLVGGAAGTSLAIPQAGQSAPEFTLTLLDGKTVALKDLRGKPVLVSFWHSG